MRIFGQKKISVILLFALLIGQAIAFPLAGVSRKKKVHRQRPRLEQKQEQKQSQSAATVTTSPQVNPPNRLIPQGESAMVRQWISRGQWQLVDKNYPEAIVIYKKVLELSPQNSRALNQLALAYYLHGQYPLALKKVDQALGLDPVNTKLYLTKARILDAQSREPEALDYYLTFASLDPTDTAVLQAQRRADELFKRWEPKLTRAQKIYFTGLRFLSMEQPQKAMPLLEKFRKEDPGNLNVHLLLGMAYFQMGQSERAVQSFKSLAEKAPEHSMAYFQLGETYVRMGELENAKSAREKFIQLAPYSTQAAVIYQQQQHAVFSGSKN